MKATTKVIRIHLVREHKCLCLISWQPIAVETFTGIQKCQPHGDVALDEKSGDHQLLGFIVCLGT